MNSAVSKNDFVPTQLPFGSGITVARTVEFFCVGGASLLIMVFCTCLCNVQFVMRDEVRCLLAQAAAATLLITALLSYPHTIWSYRFAYNQGGAFILKHAWELIGYPLIIIVLLTMCAFTWGTPVSSLGAVRALEQGASTLGVSLHWSSYESLGELLLACLLVLQIVMSGYHYGMQALGVALACGERRGYRLEAWQRKYLRLNVYTIWLVNLLSGYTFLSFLDNRCFGYRPIQFPGQWQALAATLFALSVLLVLFKVVLPNFKQNRKLPPLSSSTSMVSLWLWLQPFFQPFGFQAGIVPLAHGLQYLYFAARGEAAGFDPRISERVKDKQSLRTLWLVMLFALLVACGYLAYRYLPFQLDNSTVIKHFAPNFFIMASYIFLNTHHYMIDSVVWRGDSKLRSYMATFTAA